MIVWLASYPKSGNTWLRAIITAYTKDGAVAIDALEGASVRGRRDLDRFTGLDTAALPFDDVLALVPSIYRAHAAESAGTVWAKTHDRRVDVAGEALHPDDITTASIYLVRDPRDVAHSFAAHMGTTIDAAIDRMGDVSFRMGCGTDSWSPIRPELVGCWSEHVRSWLHGERPAHLMRYEDLVHEPVATAAAALAAAGTPVDAARVTRAVQASRFEVLAAQEQQGGFGERPPGMTRFFRSGRVGGWREALTSSQARRIVDDHGAVMTELGYPTTD